MYRLTLRAEYWEVSRVVTAQAHREWVLGQVAPTASDLRPTPECLGLALAEDVPARFDLPRWDASAMDGYAIRAVDADSESAEFRVVSEVAAGSPLDPRIDRGEAVRVMTGAPVPTAADTVVPVESTVPAGATGDPWARGTFRISRAVDRGANIRRRGEDVRVGEVVARAGERVHAARLSAIVAAGIDSLRVHASPRIAVVSTGAELMAPGIRLERGQIPESNSLLIAGSVREAGLTATTVEHCGDDASVLAARLEVLARSHDCIITTGGVGPGVRDVVRISLEGQPGVRQVRVAMRPGQLQRVGRHSGGAFFFGLPGNPVSAAVTFELFVRPALLKMAGFAQTERLSIRACVEEGWAGRSDRLQVMPVRIARTPSGVSCAPAVPAHGISHSVAGHGARDGYALIGPEVADVSVGDEVDVIVVEDR